MSISDALKFEGFNLKKMWEGLKNDPKRIFLGVDPLSTKAWNAVLGREDKPIVNQFGGPTKDTFRAAQAEGIDTGTASTLHGIAKGIAAAYGVAGAAGGLGNAAGSLAGAGGAGGAIAPVTTSVAPVGAGAAAGGAGAAALPEIVISGTGGGLTGGQIAAGVGAVGATGATGAAAANAGSSSSSSQAKPNWADYAGNIGNSMQQSGQQQQQEQERMLEELAKRGPPPEEGAGVAGLGPGIVDQYQELTAPNIRRALG